MVNQETYGKLKMIRHYNYGQLVRIQESKELYDTQNTYLEHQEHIIRTVFRKYLNSVSYNTPYQEKNSGISKTSTKYFSLWTVRLKPEVELIRQISIIGKTRKKNKNKKEPKSYIAKMRNGHDLLTYQKCISAPDCCICQT